MAWYGLLFSIQVQYLTGAAGPIANYIGPDTVLPLASAVTAVIGVVLVFGRRILMLPRSLRRSDTDDAPVTPEDFSAAPDETSDTPTRE